MKLAKYVWWVAGLTVALGIWVWLASVPWPASAESPATIASNCPKGFYRAASGDCVHRPVCGVSSPPQGATALCNDGCYSFSENADMDETCSRHGGTKQVLN
jgi:Protein of unknown function (DUF3761)